MKRTPRIVLLAIVAMVASAAQGPQRALAQDLFADARVSRWAEQVIAGQHARALREMERDLRGPAPHALVRSLWCLTHDATGGLERAIATLPADLATRLGPVPTLLLLERTGMNEAALASTSVEALVATGDPLALMHYAWAADARGQTEASARAAAGALRVAPDFMVAARHLLGARYRHGQAPLRAYAADLARGGGPLGEYARARLATETTDTLADLADLERYLQARPRDRWALLAAAEALMGLRRYADARPYLERAWAVLPWYQRAGELLTQVHARLDEHDAARRHATILARALPVHHAFPESALARGLREGERRGRARDVLSAALRAHPEDATLREEMARLELASGRPQQAIEHAERYLASARDKGNALGFMLHALSSAGRNEDAIRVYESRDPRYDSAWATENLANCLLALERYDDAVATLEAAVRAYPGSAGVRRLLAWARWSRGQRRDALRDLEAALEFEARSDWAIDRLLEWSQELDGAQRTDARLADLRRRDPGYAKLWLSAVERAGSLDAKVAILRDAAARYPREPFWNERWVALYLDAERWTDAMARATATVDALADGPAWAQASALLTRAWVVRSQAAVRQVDAAAIDGALADLDRHLALGGNVADDLYNRAALLAQAGRAEQGARVGMEYALLLRSFDAVHRLLTTHHEAIGDRFSLAASAYLEVDPFEGERLDKMADWFIKWRSSPILGLYYLHLARERAPASYSAGLAAQGFGALGDNVRHFQTEYLRANALGPSDRYVGWYESARLGAQNSSTRVGLSFDETTWGECPAGSPPPGFARDAIYAAVCNAEGEVAFRAVHPVTGKLTRLQRGASYLALEYDPSGRLLRGIDDSRGRGVTLEYDEGEHMSRMQVRDGDELRFTYNDLGKLRTMEIPGVGSIEVDYEANGEIRNVRSPQGHAMATRINSAFQRLLTLTSGVSGSSARIPDLPVDETRLRELEAASGDGSSRSALELVRYLHAHLAERVHYGAQARTVAHRVFERSARDAAGKGDAAEAAQIWHAIVGETHRNGLGREDFERWSQMRAWLHSEAAGDPRVESVRRVVEARPLRLAPAARWVARSDLSNPGYWRRHLDAAMLPEGLNHQGPVAVLVRREGDLVVGSAGGLSVFRRGYWEWFSFDAARARFVSDPLRRPRGAETEVRALAETAEGVLFVGTSDGLLVLRDYESAVTRVRAVEGALPHPAVEHLALHGDGVLAGTPGGLRVVSADGRVSRLMGVADAPVMDLRGARSGAASAVVWTSAAGVTLLRGGVTTELMAGPVRGAAWSDEAGAALIVDTRDQLHLVRPGANGVESMTGVDGAADVIAARRVLGVEPLVFDGLGLVGVLTDQGVGILRDHHLEHMDIPGGDQRVGARALHAAEGRLIVAGSDGTYVHERGQIAHHALGRVYDILSFPEQRMAVIASTDGLFALPTGESRPVRLDNIEATRLARDTQGQLVTHDGNAVLRYGELGLSQMLFEAEPTAAGRNLGYGRVSDILGDSRGRIWVAAGGSLFRYQDGEVREFSPFVDEAAFPSRSHMLSRVYESVDGTIVAVASAEGHIVHQGRRMVGGHLEYDEAREVFTRRETTPGWFAHSYTRVGEREAIVGTVSGFFRDTGQGAASLGDDPTYQRLKRRQSALFLGTRGARLGDDVWLFGSAGGVVAYRSGAWFYPDRLNWMLPNQELADYGARAVHAVAVDGAGRVLAGTDRGLLVYDAGGDDSGRFLVSNGFEFEAFGAAAHRQLSAERDTLLSGMSETNPLRERVERLREAERRVAELTARVASLARADELEGTGAAGGGAGAESAGAGEGGTTPEASAPPGEAVSAELRAARRQHAQRLLELQRENPALHRMLEIPPIDLARVQARLPAGRALVQYLPTSDRLYIQVLRRDQAVLREVTVSSRELYERARRVAARMVPGGREQGAQDGAASPTGTAPAQDAAGPTAARPEGSTTGQRGLSVRVLAQAAGQGEPPLEQSLHWLYQQLLRPVERDLVGAEHVYVVPTAALTYVPFAALMTSVEPPRYVVERYALGEITQPYMLEVMAENDRPGGEDAVIFGDPDGSLPGARSEASHIAGLFAGSVLRVGEEATFSALNRDVVNARTLHLATHGILDARRPERSWLMLAGGYRLAMADAMTLPLQNTRTVVLSACDSGVGQSGLEYATLANAFMLGGVGTVVATLWQVPDEASEALVLGYYRRMEAGSDRLNALAEAQRAMIQHENPEFRAPSQWAGYVVFGNP